MKRTNAAALSLSIGLALASCGKPADGTGAAGSRPPVAVETAKAATTELEESVAVVGTLEARNEAEVKSEYSGTVAEVWRGAYDDPALLARLEDYAQAVTFEFENVPPAALERLARTRPVWP